MDSSALALGLRLLVADAIPKSVLCFSFRFVFCGPLPAFVILSDRALQSVGALTHENRRGITSQGAISVNGSAFYVTEGHERQCHVSVLKVYEHTVVNTLLEALLLMSWKSASELNVCDITTFPRTETRGLQPFLYLICRQNAVHLSISVLLA